MVETISPVVHGGRNRRYWSSLALHVVAATVTAGAFGALLGGAGALASAPWGSVGVTIVCIVAGLYVLREAAGLPVPVFDRHRQVPEWWRTYFSAPVAALLYGAGLGIGFMTFLTFGTFVAVSVGAFISGDVVTGMVICAPFGLARSLALLTASENRDTVHRLDSLATTRGPRMINAAALAAVTIAGIATLV